MKRTLLRGILAAVVILVVVPVVIYFAFPGALVNLTNGLERRVAGLSSKAITVDSHDIAYVGKITRLRAIAKNSGRFVAQHPGNKLRDDSSIFRTRVLARAKDVEIS